uniref:Uncharacterized protein n=1 Tax=Rhizophora mucronata TaxID=61149 RepID=A0A2P2JQT2_RHIMU
MGFYPILALRGKCVRFDRSNYKIKIWLQYVH